MKVLPININSVYSYKQIAFSSRLNFILPDIKQKNEYYCAPAACANAVIMLDGNNNYKQDKLVEDLAQLFKTDKNGTTSDNLCKGIEKYYSAKGENVNIEYTGFRDVDKKYKVSSMPDLRKIQDAITSKKAVILNLGIYKKSGETYKRQYGHFVNAVGSGSNGISMDSSYLAVTDPYNKINGKHYIKLEKINKGNLIHNLDDNELALTSNAEGFYEISPKFNYFEPDETAVLNGVIVISK